MKRCADTFGDGRGLILSSTDEDLKAGSLSFPEQGTEFLENISYRVKRQI